MAPRYGDGVGLRLLLALVAVGNGVYFALPWTFDVAEVRGWLQTELTRRFGALAGLLIANAAFTFGPLHFDYYVGTDVVYWGGLAAVFGIGLFFGLFYRRSGNLWIPAVLHGIWPLNMT